MVKVELLLLAMSPCCKTFSKVDSSNTTRGHNYRLHGEDHPDRPPKDNHSEKGIEAHKADEMVMQGIEFAIWMVNSQPIPGQGAALYMENPVGSLWRRPYMRQWEEPGMVKRHEVHYCAYDHFYHKPTHIWTNMEWAPQGSTGTGRCEHRCKGGRLEHGQWVHQYKIAQASWQAKGGAQGQEGPQEYDAREAARRASGGSDHAQRKRRRMEASTGGSVQASRFVEGQTADEEEEAAEETDWHSFEFDPGVS